MYEYVWRVQQSHDFVVKEGRKGSSDLQTVQGQDPPGEEVSFCSPKGSSTIPTAK